MSTGISAGTGDHYTVLAGNSTDYHAHGGHDLDPPAVTNKRVQVRNTDHPATDRWITLTTTHQNGTYLYVVGVVDGFNHPTQPPEEFSTLRRARNAANRIYTAMTEEETA